MPTAPSTRDAGPFDSLDVYRAEWDDIRRRRAGAAAAENASPEEPPPRLVGFALSGGGVRSATFNLGVLQALEAELPGVDYLSTVSGGGYIGGWWSAWRTRTPRAPGAFPPSEGVETWRHAVRPLHHRQVDPARTPAPDPVHHVRLFSNYLTPRKGLLSRDLWRAITVVTRNLVLTWAALLPFIAIAVMLAYAAFIWIHGEPADPRLHLALPADKKLRAVLGLPGIFLAAFIALSFVWMLVQRGNAGPQTAITIAAAAAVGWTLAAGAAPAAGSRATTEWLIAAVVVGVGALRVYRSGVRGRHFRDIALNWISRLQGVVLVGAVAALAIGLVAAYGAWFVAYLLEDGAGAWEERAKTIGTYLGLLTWGASTGWAAVTGAPAGGGEAKGAPSSRSSRLLLSLSPPLTMILLLLAAAWATERLVQSVPHDAWIPMVRDATLIGAIAMACFAVAEHQKQARSGWAVLAPAAAVVVAGAAGLAGAGPGPLIGWSAAGLVAVSVWRGADRCVPEGVRGSLPAALQPEKVELDRAMLLAGAACVLVLGSGVVQLDAANVHGDVRLLLGLSALLFTSVILLGWTTDPNALSLHNFYKMRLVRAYLGASNAERTKHDAEDITESRAHDDLRLADLSPHDGPYHLINATLNLSTGSDLVVAQRAAAPFLFSRQYCGSPRTGFRRTDRYRAGTLTLGTAVAISGAAASPVMGSLTPSTAMSMLLALLNVRLGYWLPTPNRSDWQAPQARLWPFYLLREFFSHIADTGGHCYVTDGGHFDNTGVYPLIERGCSTVIVTDCGADPDCVFDDLATLVRRARIDFGASITFETLDPFARSTVAADRRAFVVGRIAYRREHLKALGWSDAAVDRGAVGTLILVKPTLWGRLETDVNRYGQQQPDFPQQATADQWFDEAQFESYRRLGEISGREARREVRAAVFAGVDRQAAGATGGGRDS